MRDPRVANLAKILVGYSTKVGEGETCLIEGPSAAEPLVAAVYDEVLAAGGNPVVGLSFDGQSAAYLANATDAQLEWISHSRGGVRKRPTAASRSARIRTRASSPRFRRSARRSARRRLAT